VDFDPVGSEPLDFIVDELFGDAAAVGEGGHAGDGGGEFAEVVAPLGFGGGGKFEIGAEVFTCETLRFARLAPNSALPGYLRQGSCNGSMISLVRDPRGELESRL
jgi:hypothetical protein